MVSPQFWTGFTGQQLRKDADAQRLALYLMTCPNSNMIGLYYLPVPVICHELGMTDGAARKALRRGMQLEFCDYDEASEVIFVFEMARFQCGQTLSHKDKRKPAVENLLRTYRKCKFYTDFLSKYGDAYGLKMIIENMPLRRGMQVSPQDQDQDQDQDREYPPNPPRGEEPAKGVKPRKPEQHPERIPIPQALDRTDFIAAWGVWLNSRTAASGKSKMTELAASLQLKKLAALGSIPSAIEVVEFSTMNGYQGLVFDRKGAKPPPATHRPPQDKIENFEGEPVF